MRPENFKNLPSEKNPGRSAVCRPIFFLPKTEQLHDMSSRGNKQQAPLYFRPPCHHRPSRIASSPSSPHRLLDVSYDPRRSGAARALALSSANCPAARVQSPITKSHPPARNARCLPVLSSAAAALGARILLPESSRRSRPKRRRGGAPSVVEAFAASSPCRSPPARGRRFRGSFVDERRLYAVEGPRTVAVASRTSSSRDEDERDTCRGRPAPRRSGARGHVRQQSSW